MTPKTMFARHFETGQWHRLALSEDAAFWMPSPSDWYYDDDFDERVSLHDFDSFSGVNPNNLKEREMDFCPTCGSSEIELEPDNTTSDRDAYWLCHDCETEIEAQTK